MTIHSTIEYSFPSENFWKDYEQLWQHSFHKPVFQSPSFIRNLAEKFADFIAVFKFYIDGELKGATFFRYSQGEYHFLSDIKTDHNFFVLHADCSEEHMRQFFNVLLDHIDKEKWALVLNYKPEWANYMNIFNEVAKRHRVFWTKAKYSVCPVLEQETPEGLFEKLSKSKNIKTKLNRLKRESSGEVVFETFLGDEDLEEWIEGFCKFHIVRWENTPTPSKYLDPANKQLLKECLLAWMKDGVLVRFSIKIGQDRIAHCIALTQAGSLIHHTHTYDPSYGDYSPSKILLKHIGEWVKDKHLTTLDFGDGNEPYKYSYANKELSLVKIFISSPTHWQFRLKVELIKAIRRNNIVMNFYRNTLSPLFKSLFAVEVMEELYVLEILLAGL